MKIGEGGGGGYRPLVDGQPAAEGQAGSGVRMGLWRVRGSRNGIARGGRIFPMILVVPGETMYPHILDMGNSKIKGSAWLNTPADSYQPPK